MTDVPKDAREQLEAFARGHNMMTFGTESVPMWVLDLALSRLDLEAASCGAVTEEMVDKAHAAGQAAIWTLPGAADLRAVTRAILEAVAPRLVLAGRVQGLEEAAARIEQIAIDCERDPAAWVEGPERAELLSAARSHRETAAAIRALKGRTG